MRVSDAVPPNAPEWDDEQQVAWMECFLAFSNLTLTAHLDAAFEREQTPKEHEMEEAVKLAAKLSDTALKEIEWRFYNHAPAHPRPRPKRRTYGPRKRTP